jgi:hypothetical protein
MKQIIIKSISIILILILFGYGAYLRVSNLDMTDIRWIITYWKEYLFIVLGILANGLILGIKDVK